MLKDLQDKQYSIRMFFFNILKRTYMLMILKNSTLAYKNSHTYTDRIREQGLPFRALHNPKDQHPRQIVKNNKVLEEAAPWLETE